MVCFSIEIIYSLPFLQCTQTAYRQCIYWGLVTNHFRTQFVVSPADWRSAQIKPGLFVYKVCHPCLLLVELLHDAFFHVNRFSFLFFFRKKWIKKSECVPYIMMKHLTFTKEYNIFTLRHIILSGSYVMSFCVSFFVVVFF